MDTPNSGRPDDPAPSSEDVVEAFKLILADRMAARKSNIPGADPEWQSSARLHELRAALPEYDPAQGCAVALPLGRHGAFVAFAALPQGHTPADLDPTLLRATEDPAFLAASETFDESFALYSERASAEAAAARMREAMAALPRAVQARSGPRRPQRESSGA